MFFWAAAIVYENIAMGKSATASKALWNAPPSNLNDGNDDTYLWFGLGEDPVSWTSITVDLEISATVLAVRLKMSGKEFCRIDWI